MFARQCLQVRCISSIANLWAAGAKPIVVVGIPHKYVPSPCVGKPIGRVLPVYNPSASLSSSADAPPPPVPVASYEEVLDLPNHPEILLVDVREPSELKETGKIPTSINVPLADVAKAFSGKTSADEFERLYGHEKPGADDAIIVYCRSGRRSELAAQSLTVLLGYTNVKNYRGSWLEWAEKNGLPQ